MGAAALGMLLAVGFALPWLAERDLRDAREISASNPELALEKLDRSSRLNPLSPLADKTAALVLLRSERFDRARAELRQAIERDERDSFAWMQLGAIASVEMRQADAVRHLERARRALAQRHRGRRRAQGDPARPGGRPAAREPGDPARDRRSRGARIAHRRAKYAPCGLFAVPKPLPSVLPTGAVRTISPSVP